MEGQTNCLPTHPRPIPIHTLKQASRQQASKQASKQASRQAVTDLELLLLPLSLPRPDIGGGCKNAKIAMIGQLGSRATHSRGRQAGKRQAGRQASRQAGRQARQASKQASRPQARGMQASRQASLQATLPNAFQTTIKYTKLFLVKNRRKTSFTFLKTTCFLLKTILQKL